MTKPEALGPKKNGKRTLADEFYETYEHGDTEQEPKDTVDDMEQPTETKFRDLERWGYNRDIGN